MPLESYALAELRVGWQIKMIEKATKIIVTHAPLEPSWGVDGRLILRLWSRRPWNGVFPNTSSTTAIRRIGAALYVDLGADSLLRRSFSLDITSYSCTAYYYSKESAKRCRTPPRYRHSSHNFSTLSNASRYLKIQIILN